VETPQSRAKKKREERKEKALFGMDGVSWRE